MKTIKFLFSSLISNDTVINESKHKPWWLAIVMMIVSCFVSIIPIFTSIMSVNGGSILTASENYNIDYSLKKFSLDYLTKENLSFTVENGQLIYNDSEDPTNKNFKAEIKHGEDISLLVYYVDYQTSDEVQYGSFDNMMNTKIKEFKTAYPTGAENKSYMYSMLILGKEKVYLYLYGAKAESTYTVGADGAISITNETSTGNAFSGTYEGIDGDLTNLKNFVYGDNDSLKAEHAYSKWQEFFDKAYAKPRNSLAFKYSGILLGFNVVIAFAMSLMIFLLSRTKTSIRKFKYLESLKMVFFASLSPAIVALILSLIMPSFQSMAFLMCFMLRLVWLSMKATSPSNNQTATRK